MPDRQRIAAEKGFNRENVYGPGGWRFPERPKPEQEALDPISTP